MRPIAKLKASFSGRTSNEPADRQERQSDEDGDEGDQPRHAAYLALERAQFGLDPLRQRCDPAQLRLHSGFERRARVASPPTQDEPLNTRSRASISGPVVSRELGRAVDRLRLPGQRREIDVERPLEQPCVRRDPVTLRSRRTSPGTSVPRRPSLAARPGAPAPAAGGSARSASIARSAWRSCDECEDGVEDESRPRSRRRVRRTTDEGESGREPEQKRQRVGELLHELARPADAAAPAEFVPPVDDQAALRLAAREAVRTRAQVAQKRDRLAWVVLSGGLGFFHCGSPKLGREIAPFEGKHSESAGEDSHTQEKAGVAESQSLPERVGGDVVVVRGGLARELEGVDERAERADEIRGDAEGGRRPRSPRYVARSPLPRAARWPRRKTEQGGADRGGGQVRSRDVHSHDLDTHQE